MARTVVSRVTETSSARPAAESRIGHDFEPTVGRRVLRWLGMGLFVLYLAAGGAFLYGKYVLLPDIGRYRPQIEALVSQALGLRVAFPEISAEWRGLRPAIALRGATIFDPSGRPALSFGRLHAELAWRSLLFLDLRLHRLEIDRPELFVRRDREGHVFVAGLRIDGDGAGGFGDWVLKQVSIEVIDARLRWEDGLRAAPPLELERVRLRLDNFGSRHRLALSARPPPGRAGALDVRADLRGDRWRELAAWDGESYLELRDADLSAWRPWLDYPIDLARGVGSLRAWVTLRDLSPVAVKLDLALAQVAVRLGAELPLMELAEASGRLSAGRGAATEPDGTITVAGQNLVLVLGEGAPAQRFAPAAFRLSWQPASAKRPEHGELSGRGLDLEVLSHLTSFLPLPGNLREQVAAHAPKGQVAEMSFVWSGALAAPTAFKVDASFRGLGHSAAGGVPGFSGLSGHLVGTETSGTLSIDGGAAVFELPDILAEPRVALERLALRARWKRLETGLEFGVQEASFENADAAGTLSGVFRTRPGAPGDLDLDVRIARANGAVVWRYMPLGIDRDVRAWVRAAVRAGNVHAARIVVKGDLGRFPFADRRGGQFLATVPLSAATLRFAPEWPEIRDLSGELTFEGSGMRVRARQGRILGTGIGPTQAEIRDLGHDPVLTVRGRASGPTAEFLRFVEASPVGTYIDHFTEDMRATGQASLDLALTIPLGRTADTSARGSLSIVDNRLVIDPALPPLTETSALIEFGNDALSVRNAQGKFLGQPLTLTAHTRNGGGVQAQVQGGATMAALYRFFEWPLLEHLSGAANWSGRLDVRKKSVDFTLDSNLQGIASSLPAPFNKSAAEAMPLRVERVESSDGGRSREVWRASLGNVARMHIERRRQGAEAMSMATAVTIGTAELPALPERGIQATVRLPRLDLDAWRRIVADGMVGGMAVGSGSTQLDLKADELHLFGQQLAAVTARVRNAAGGWAVQLASNEASGDIAWRPQEGSAGRVVARFSKLGVGDDVVARGDASSLRTNVELPAFDVQIEQFSWAGNRVGRLEFVARNRGGTWRLDPFVLSNPDGRLSGEGAWSFAATQPDTRIKIKFDSGNVGKLLERFGHADLMRRGTANLEASLAWRGPPTTIDYPTLEGEGRLAARNGQFSRIEPGVGRLLGVLSLQSLPRRITLDFRDIFSEGLAFDQIDGAFRIQRGVMRSDDLIISGPSAKIFMRGEVSLQRETQDLRVRVQPALGESVAVGTMLANPAVGLAALLASKVLRDPIDKLFAYEYHVTGSWVDPKVEKLAEPVPGKPDPDAGPATR
ncbi:MAG: hypothetical protein AMXMBFR6_22540 [Betaproteobacteria bacterium]